jgi:hypothetical protein
MPGIRAWAVVGRACQDRNAGNQGLGRDRNVWSGRKCRESGLGWGPGEPARTGTSGNRAWLPLRRAFQAGNAGNLGLGGVRESLPGREPRGIGLGCRSEGHSRTGMPGIWAWVGSGRACQDGNLGESGLAAAPKGIPGRECRELGLGWGPGEPARTGTPGNWAWVGAGEAGQDGNAGDPVLGRLMIRIRRRRDEAARWGGEMGRRDGPARWAGEMRQRDGRRNEGQRSETAT